jgi:hypothetical protein
MKTVGGPFWLLSLCAVLPAACDGGTAGAPVTGGDSGGSSGSSSGGGADTGVSAPAADGTAAGQGGGDDAQADVTTADSALEAAIDAPSQVLPLPDGSAACKTAGTELCDGFETGMIDPKIWGMQTTTGTSITVDKMQVHTGSYAAHIKLVPGQSNTAQITDAVTFPAKNNTFYTRAFFFISPDLPFDMAGGYHQAYLLATGNNTLGFVEAGLGSAGNKQYLGFSEYFGAGPKTASDPSAQTHGATFTEFGPDSPTQVVPMKWICMELMQGGDATTTHRRVWIDGKELPEQKSDFSMRPPPMFALMSIGTWQYHTTPILSDIWIDDVRVSSAMIGCNVP